MKKVVVLTRNTVTSDKITSNKYYGVIKEGEKSFVTKTAYHGGEYILRCVNAVTMGNGYSSYTGQFLPNVIEEIVNAGNEVFEFDHPHELFRWLSTPVNSIDNEDELV